MSADPYEHYSYQDRGAAFKSHTQNKVLVKRLHPGIAPAHASPNLVACGLCHFASDLHPVSLTLLTFGIRSKVMKSSLCWGAFATCLALLQAAHPW